MHCLSNSEPLSLHCLLIASLFPFASLVPTFLAVPLYPYGIYSFKANSPTTGRIGLLLEAIAPFAWLCKFLA